MLHKQMYKRKVRIGAIGVFQINTLYKQVWVCTCTCMSVVCARLHVCERGNGSEAKNADLRVPVYLQCVCVSVCVCIHVSVYLDMYVPCVPKPLYM